MSELDLSKGIDLGPKMKGRVGGGISGIARKLDAHGTFEADMVVTGPNTAQAVPSRGDYLDAQELIDEIIDGCRIMIREELAAFYQRMRKLEEIANP